MLAATDWGTYAAIASVVGVALAVGGVFGRATANVLKGRQEAEAARDRRRETELMVVQALTGKDADKWGPARKGLIEMMDQMQKDFTAHVIADREFMDKATQYMKDHP